MRRNARLMCSLLAVFCLAACLKAKEPASGTASYGGSSGGVVKGSVVNTVDNTYQKNGKWESTMGPLNPNRGGIACDHIAANKGNPDLYRTGDYALWFIAPSDSLSRLGIKTCGPNPYGGEPSCEENWSLCGRKVRLTCANTEWCGTVGQPSLMADITNGKRPTNNYIPDFYAQEVAARVGSQPSVPKSIVLYVTDFCPASHSVNRATNNCQGEQVDLSTASLLLVGKQNPQGYISSELAFQVELLPEGDSTAAGPEY